MTAGPPTVRIDHPDGTVTVTAGDPPGIDAGTLTAPEAADVLDDAVSWLDLALDEVAPNGGQGWMISRST